MFRLQIVSSVLLGATDVPCLGGLGPAEEQQDHTLPVFPEVEPVAGAKRESGFPDPATDRLVVPRFPVSNRAMRAAIRA